MAQRREFEIPEGWVARGWRFEVEVTGPGQWSVIARQFGGRRYAYNWALAQVKANLDARAADPTVAPLRWSLYDLRRAWNQVKQESAPWWRECSKEAYVSGITDLVAALHNWSDAKHGHRARRVGFPRFKARHRDRGRVRFTTGAMRLEPDRRHLILPVIGRLRSKENTRRLQRLIAKGRARILSMTLSEHGGRLFVSVATIVAQAPRTPAQPEARCGIDLGIGQEWAVIAHDDTIQRVAHPAPWAATQEEHRRVARQLSRRIVGSRGHRQTRAKLAALDRRAANLRTHQVHTLTTRLSRRYGTIVVEDLDIKAIARGGMGRRGFRRSVYQAGLGKIRPMLAYKCGWAGGHLLVADRWFASSKTHHGCGGYLADLRLGERQWLCPACGGLVDRNANAARNLRDWTGPMSPTGMSSVGVVDAPVPYVGDHGGQAHALAWACEALQDHREVAGADDTRTEPDRGRGTPNRGTSREAVTDAH